MSVLFVLSMGACSGFGGGCGGCGAGPLPAGGVPTNQTVEGGAQIRVTPSGFNQLKAILPALANSAFGNGYCVAQQEWGFDDPIFGTFTGIRGCSGNEGAGCNPGCKIDVSANPGGIVVTPLPGNLLRVNISMTAMAHAQLKAFIASLQVGGDCNIDVTSTNFGGSFDIKLGTRTDNGELTINLDKINQFNLNMDFSGCGFASDVLEFFADILDSFIGQFVIQLLTPYIDDLLQQLLPQPLGIANMMDIGALVEGISPGTDGFMEARVVPGGYAAVANGGLNLGVITGLNADEDPATRGALASEPHLCVPPLAQPNFGNLGLGQVYRSAFGGNTFTLNAAGEFSGAPDPTIPGQTVDLSMGISETTLDLAGHHLVTSGGLCLGVGTTFIPQLNVGTIGILVPSLAELASDEGNDPLLLVTRPQRALNFTVGDNTMMSPALTIHFDHLEVDFYGFLFERYTRAFTLDLTMNVGINLEFEQQGSMTVIKPSLVGISSSEVTVKVLNSQFVAETPQHLESVLPSVFDLVTPLLGSLPDIPVPAFAGLSVNPLKVTKVTTSQDVFLALYAQLGSSPMMRTIAETNPDMAVIVQKMDEGIPAAAPPSTARATLLSVDTPDPAIIRDALIKNEGALPSVAFEVQRYDEQGRELEWTWNINGGYFRPYTTANPLVISDRAFAWQGKYEIGLKSRVKGNFRTTSELIRQKVVIDSVGPRIFADKAKFEDDELKVPAWDVVGGRDFEVAYGKVGEDEPATAWMPYREAKISRERALALAVAGEILMYTRDELGNQTVGIIAFHGQAGSSGCSCETSGAPSTGGLLLIAMVGLGLFGRRRRSVWIRHLLRLANLRAARTVVLFVGMVGISSLVPACSCGDTGARSCETAADCGPDFCDEGQLPFCIENTCVCSDDIPAGRIGPYSDVAFGGGQIWVSAYASTRGDLVVANAQAGRIPNESWEWVDGVPDGPILVPDSKIRNGIDEPGADVGMYTSIQVANDGTPMVSYFDRDTASLKFASKAGGAWTTHIVAQGTSQIDPGSGGTLVGMYTSLTLRSDDGRPGIAYLAHVQDAMGKRAEVRYAAAQTPTPTQPSDWQFWVVDTAPIPDDPDEVYPLPGGLGLFVDSARNPMNQAPVVVYYDRTNGDLKLAKFNPQSGQFATPVILDGSGSIDAGWSPSVQVDTTGTVHVVYVSATGDDLKYTTDAMNAPRETVDDGYRIVGTTVDGLPKPEFHFVGDDANLILVPGGQPTVVYQDATTQEVLVAQKATNGTWVRTSVAGGPQIDPWPGAYGFFASGALSSSEIIISSWVIHQPENDNWVEVLARPFAIQ